MAKPNWIQKALQSFLGINQNGRLIDIQRKNIVNVSYWGFNAQHQGGYSDGITAYSRSAVLYSVINRITKTAAIAPWKVYTIKDQKKHWKYKQWTGENATQESLQRAMQIKELVYEENSNHPMNALLERPNEWTKGNEFIINAIGFKLLKGNRYIRVLSLDMGKNQGLPYALELLPPQFVSIVPTGDLYGVDGYWFRMGGYEELIPKEQIVHSKDFNPNFDNMGSHLYGLSKIEVGSMNLQVDESALNRELAMLDNAGAAGLLFDESGSDDDESLEYNGRLKKKVNDEILGTGNAGRIAIANKKMGYIDLAHTAAEMEIIELRKYSQQQICNLFGVPPGLFNPDQMSLNNAREFKKELLTSAVTPPLSELRDDFNQIAQMYGDKNLYVDYDISAYPELQEDMDKVAARLEKMYYWTGNEKRLATGMDEDGKEGMLKSYLVPSGLTPIDQLGDNTDAILGNMVDNSNNNL
jgi:HK97 family phage portal protein